MYMGGKFVGNTLPGWGRLAYMSKVGSLGSGVTSLEGALAASETRSAVKAYFRGPLARLFSDYKTTAQVLERYGADAGAIAAAASRSNPYSNTLGMTSNLRGLFADGVGSNGLLLLPVIMRKFVVRCFSDENQLGDLVVLEDRGVFSASFPSATKPTLADGFCVWGGTAPDFIVAVGTRSAGDQRVPDWAAGKIIGLQGRVYSDADFVESCIREFLFLRRFRAVTRTGNVIDKWYVVPWREWVVPTDPSMPWGRDFYKYLEFRLRGK